MSKILFLNTPANGHVNPTLGLVNELVKHGEEVVYFCTDEYKERIEKTGAIFKTYGKNPIFLTSKLNISGNINIGISHYLNLINNIINTSEEIIEYILQQTKDLKFDYIIYGSTFPIGNIISQILGIPSICSFAIFATKKDFISKLLPLGKPTKIIQLRLITTK